MFIQPPSVTTVPPQCGGKPAVPSIPGAEYGISSDGFFDLATQPKKAVVIGAGYIAVEMAGILHGLGTESHLAFRGKTVLRRGFDPFIVETLMAHMQDHGPVLHPNSDPKSITKVGRSVRSVWVGAVGVLG